MTECYKYEVANATSVDKEAIISIVARGSVADHYNDWNRTWSGVDLNSVSAIGGRDAIDNCYPQSNTRANNRTSAPDSHAVNAVAGGRGVVDDSVDTTGG